MKKLASIKDIEHREKIAEQFRQYLSEGDYDAPYSTNTIRTYMSAVRSFIEFCAREEVERFDEVNVPLIRKFINGRPHSSYVTVASGLDHFFNFLMLEGMAHSNVISAYRAERKKKAGGRKQQRLPSVLQRYQIEKLMDYAATLDSSIMDRRNEAIVGLILDSGLREHEVCNLTIEDGEQYLRTGALRIFGKGNKERVVHCLQHHVGIVEEYLRSEREGFSSAKNSAYLFPSKKGPRISERSLYSAVNRLLLESGAWTKQPAGPHLLRHTAASLMLAEGRTLVEVKESLGHVSLLTTQRYVHLIR